MQNIYNKSKIRKKFSEKMSSMYKEEVPLYGDMINLVSEINDCYIEKNSLEEEVCLERVSAEKHGAIRLGNAEEMHNMARLFAVMGMHPVGYYDLTQSGLPVHSTAFRPIDVNEMEASPFRIFTSLLRLDRLPDNIKQKAEIQLSKRNIFSKNLLELIDNAEKKGFVDDIDEFVFEAIKTFKWHKKSLVDKVFYEEMLQVSGLVADIVSFATPHINHLTPRVLDIDKAHNAMNERGLKTIAAVQGPPHRKYNILLRQTSFQALDEITEFNGEEEGSHRARFGEIEQRGIALTPKGRNLYDALLAEVHEKTQESDPEYMAVLKTVFTKFPDDLNIILREELAYFTFVTTDKPLANIGNSIVDMVLGGYLKATPITYEDFLPVSAAGIFKSNLSDKSNIKTSESVSMQSELEGAIGQEIIDPFEIYASQQKKSLDLIWKVYKDKIC